MSDRATPYTDAEYIKWIHLPMNDQLTNMHLHARRLERELTQVQKQLNHTFEELTETRTQRDRLAEAIHVIVFVARKNLDKPHPTIERVYAKALDSMKGGTQ
jgi:branched-subunit amino acid aminotransferase/4-amino-4-deoxychorismate lyase